jgi:hypothetical protein
LKAFEETEESVSKSTVRWGSHVGQGNLYIKASPHIALFTTVTFVLKYMSEPEII